MKLFEVADFDDIELSKSEMIVLLLKKYNRLLRQQRAIFDAYFGEVPSNHAEYRKLLVDLSNLKFDIKALRKQMAAEPGNPEFAANWADNIVYFKVFTSNDKKTARILGVRIDGTSVRVSNDLPIEVAKNLVKQYNAGQYSLPPGGVPQ